MEGPGLRWTLMFISQIVYNFIMKKIIVPVDFSEQSEYALKVATTLAKRYQAAIYVMHMLELEDDTTYTIEMIYQEQTASRLKLAEKQISEFLDKSYLKGVRVIPMIKHHKVFREINKVVEEQGADLIVMGSHGIEGLKEMFVGSTTEKVVRHSKIPVLVIKHQFSDFKIDRFVFACDFSLNNAMAFQKAKAFADLFSAELDLVYINTPGDNFLSTEDIQDRIAQFLKEAKVIAQVNIHNDYTVEKGILNYCEKTLADAIGIPTHGRKGLAHFFMGSIGEDVANHAKIPVVTFKMG